MAVKKPLYVKVRDTLIERLSGSVWAPGEILPSEIALAEELGVSQGTVRKAIDSLCAEGALRRVQGSGTYVSEQTEELANFKFLRLTDATGNRVVPTLMRQIASSEAADPVMAGTLALEDGATVHVLDRIRSIGDAPALIERITVPDAVMPGLSEEAPLPNALYPHYQARYGVHVIRTEDMLGAISADARQARMLSVDEGAPLLQAERVAFDLTGRPVEHRRSQILSEGLAFRVDLS